MYNIKKYINQMNTVCATKTLLRFTWRTESNPSFTPERNWCKRAKNVPRRKYHTTTNNRTTKAPANIQVVGDATKRYKFSFISSFLSKKTPTCLNCVTITIKVNANNIITSNTRSVTTVPNNLEKEYAHIC